MEKIEFVSGLLFSGHPRMLITIPRDIVRDNKLNRKKEAGCKFKITIELIE